MKANSAADGPDNSPAPDQAEELRRPNPRLLEILVCPVTKASLDFDSEANELISRQARLAYPIIDGVPMMTEDAARQLTDEDLTRGR